MKKLLFVIASFIAIAAPAQQPFEGTLIYQVKLNTPDPDPSESKFLNNTQLFYCSGKMVRYQGKMKAYSTLAASKITEYQLQSSLFYWNLVNPTLAF